MTSLQKLSGLIRQSNIHFDANNRFVFACYRLRYTKDASDLEINSKKHFMMLDCNSIIFKNIMFIIIFYLNPLLSNESILPYHDPRN